MMASRRLSAAANPIREYYAKIESGEEIVSDKVRRTYKKVVADLDSKNSEYYYDPKRAQHVIDFVQKYCRHSKGKLGGQKIQLELWEKAFLSTVFGFVDIEGNRKYREAILIIGRKNGKSLLASAIGLYLMLADGEAGADVYAVATTRDQAKIVWLEAKRMVKKSPVLLRRVRPLVGEMVADFNEATFRPLASDSDTLDGLNVHGSIMDELAAWKRGKELYDVVIDGNSAREQPLNIITTTAGTVREDIYDQKYDEARRVINGYDDPAGYHDETMIAFIYELDKRAEWTDPSCWKKANPGLGTIKNYETLARKVERAKDNPGLVKNLVCKEFNIPETSSEAWLTFEEVENRTTYDLAQLKPRYGIGGVDLSSTTDLTAAKVIFQVRGDPHIYVKSMYWLPEDLIEKRVREDKIPYDVWIERGLMRTCAGNKVYAHDVVNWFVEQQEQNDIYIPWIGYDSWSATYFVEEMRGHFGAESMVPVIQGYKTLSAPMKSLGADLAAKLIVYNDNPLDKWNFSNVAYEEDKNANIRPCKTSRPTRRIDGFMALLDAYVVLQDKKTDYENMI